MKNYILLAKVTDIDRGTMERIEGTTISEKNLVKRFNNKIKRYSLSDFMDLCNNEELELNDYWISYIKF